MRPLTDSLPKPLLKVRGKALIEWIIENLVRAGIQELVINHSYLGAAIEQALGSGGRYGARIAYSHEPEALETAGGIANALDLIGGEPFLAVNGDIYTSYDYSALAAKRDQMMQGGQQAHLVLVDNPAHNPLGDFSLHDGLLGNDGPAKLTFSGIALYEPSLFAGIDKGRKARLAPLLRAAAAAGRAGGEHFRGSWHDVGTPERLRALQN